VAPRAELHYLPGIIWIPSGLRTRADLVVPLDNFLRRTDVDFHAAEVTGLADGGRTVHTTLGDVANDALVIATGGRFIKKLPGIEHAITPCEGITAAERIRDRLREMQGGTIAVGFAGNPNEPTAVRGGPMFEFLFGIDEQLKREGRRERFEIVFFNPSTEPGNRLGPKAVKHLLGEMAARHPHPPGPQAQALRGRQGGDRRRRVRRRPDPLHARHDRQRLVRCHRVAPLAGRPAAGRCAVPHPGAERTYVVGDSGSFPGPDWMPKQAHMADLQAAAAAENLLATCRAAPPTPPSRSS
jgi:sulfide:quinone oxidoreductase